MEATANTAATVSPVRMWVTCPMCDGHGEIQPGRDPQHVTECRLCHGDTVVLLDRAEQYLADEAEAGRPADASAELRTAAVVLAAADLPF